METQTERQQVQQFIQLARRSVQRRDYIGSGSRNQGARPSGLAYRLGDRTVLRASFGVNFDEWAAVMQNSRNYHGSWSSRYFPDHLLQNPYSLQWNFGVQHELN